MVLPFVDENGLQTIQNNLRRLDSLANDILIAAKMHNDHFLIPPDYQNDIFDEYRVIAMREKNGPQIGLGLAFCKMVVEAHNGRIYVSPNKPGGSIFTVEL